MGYSLERKSAVLKRMLPANNMAIRQLSQDEGISEATLHKWQAEARGKGQARGPLKLITERMDACANVLHPAPKGLGVVRMDGKQTLPRQLVFNHLEVIVSRCP